MMSDSRGEGGKKRHQKLDIIYRCYVIKQLHGPHFTQFLPPLLLKGTIVDILHATYLLPLDHVWTFYQPLSLFLSTYLLFDPECKSLMDNFHMVLTLEPTSYEKNWIVHDIFIFQFLT
jgi:hypothetical protein